MWLTPFIIASFIYFHIIHPAFSANFGTYMTYIHSRAFIRWNLEGGITHISGQCLQSSFLFLLLSHSMESLIKCVCTRRVILRENHFAVVCHAAPMIITRLRTFREDLGGMVWYGMVAHVFIYGILNDNSIFTFLMNGCIFLNQLFQHPFSLTLMHVLSNPLCHRSHLCLNLGCGAIAPKLPH